MSLQCQQMKVKSRSPSPFKGTPNKTLNQEVEKLLEEKEALIGYIEEQKVVMNRKIGYIAELEEEVNRLSDKEELLKVKVTQDIAGLKKQNRELREEIERSRMEGNLMEIRFKEDYQKAQEKIEQMEQTLTQKEKVQVKDKTQTREMGTQKEDTVGELVLK